MKTLKGVNSHRVWGTNCCDIFGFAFLFILRLHPMTILKMEVSMVIEELYHHGWGEDT